MTKTFEKSVTLIGNIIAILTFVLAVLNWLGLSVVLDATIPNKRVAMAILIAYAFLASYGAANVLLERTRAEKDTLLLWFMLTFSYVLGFLFLLEKARPVLQISAINEQSFTNAAMGCNVFVYMVTYLFPKISPTLTLKSVFTDPFAGFKDFMFALVHLGVVAVLFRLLSVS
jgi:hypothetical protein